MANRNLKGDVNVEFTEATSRQGLDSGESVKTLFGKIRKWLSDLKAVAFSGSYNDLDHKPTLGSAAFKNVPSTGNASTSEVVMGNDSRLSDSRPASDVSAWAKATTKPTYTASEVWKSGIIGSNVSDLNKKYWFKVASTTNKSINFDINGVFLIEDTYYYSKRNAIIKIDTRNYATIDADGLVYLKFIANNGFSINDIVVVSKYEDSTRKYELWVKNTTVWNAIRTTVLSEGHRGGTLANYWTIYNNFANSNVGETSYPTDGWKAYFPEDDISGELDCLTIQAALVNNEVVIQNTSDFTSELYSKYFSYTKPKFAILKLQITSNTHYYKALINSLSVSQGNLMEASFITVNGGYMGIYNFRWNFSSTVGTPTVTRKALNLGS